MVTKCSFQKKLFVVECSGGGGGAKGGRRLLLGGMVRRGVHRGCSEGGRNKNEGVAGTFFYTARASREAD